MQENNKSSHDSTSPISETELDPQNVLGDGIGFCVVNRVSAMNGDQEIVDFARVCVKGQKEVSSNRGLIRYLMRHRHTTPFESVQVWLHVKAPIFVARQWFRHRTWSYNEISGRYAELPNENYVPESWRLQSKENKQGSREGEATGIDTAFDNLLAMCQEVYQGCLDRGIAKELSRIGLPVTRYTEWRCSVNLWNLMHFLSLRMDDHAQWEIRQYAKAIFNQIVNYAPLAMEAFHDYILHAQRFSEPEMQVLKDICDYDKLNAVVGRYGLSQREVKELKAKLNVRNTSEGDGGVG